MALIFGPSITNRRRCCLNPVIIVRAYFATVKSRGRKVAELVVRPAIIADQPSNKHFSGNNAAKGFGDRAVSNLILS